MQSKNCLLSARPMAVFGTLLLFAAGVAGAQVAKSVPGSGDSSSGAAITMAYSSSNDASMAGGGASEADLSGIPAEPSPMKDDGGQYDNTAGKAGHDWKSRLAFEVGGGFNTPTSDTRPYLGNGGQVTVGGGLHFSRVFTLLAEYQFIYDQLPSRIVAEAGADGGNVHMWSLTLDPVINLMPKKATSAYVTGGGGFYRKVTNFTSPQAVEYCNYYYCGIGYQNAVIGHFSSNQGGWNVGGGVSHRFGGAYGDGTMELFAEARYLDVMTPAVTTEPNGLGQTTVGAETTLVPISFGLRF